MVMFTLLPLMKLPHHGPEKGKKHEKSNNWMIHLTCRNLTGYHDPSLNNKLFVPGSYGAVRESSLTFYNLRVQQQSGVEGKTPGNTA